jgi:hypothetical protein
MDRKSEESSVGSECNDEANKISDYQELALDSERSEDIREANIAAAAAGIL